MVYAYKSSYDSHYHYYCRATAGWSTCCPLRRLDVDVVKFGYMYVSGIRFVNLLTIVITTTTVGRLLDGVRVAL